MQGECHDYGGRDWSDTSTSQEMPKIVGHHQELREKHAMDSLLEPSEKVWPY